MIAALHRVEYLLSIARLPDRLYGVYYGLQGRDAIYKNPGTSLRSFIVARHIRDEQIALSSEMLDNLLECEQFSTIQMIEKIFIKMMSISEAAMDIMAEGKYENATVPADNIRFLASLLEHVSNTFTELIKLKDHSRWISTPIGVEFKDTLYKVQDLLQHYNLLERLTCE